MKVVVSQPMFLPWPGLLEQARLADVFVHYDDVQLPQGRSFMSRVQVRTQAGSKWLTAPLDRKGSGRNIDETLLAKDDGWRQQHMQTLRHAYGRASFAEQMFAIAHDIYSIETRNLAMFNAESIEKMASFFGLQTQFYRSSKLNIGGRSSRRLIDICRHFGASEYITGHGASNYLDHDAFEAAGIDVSYMKYECTPYPQLHGAFTPYVSALDLVANCGRNGAQFIRSGTVNWKAFLNGSH